MVDPFCEHWHFIYEPPSVWTHATLELCEPEEMRRPSTWYIWRRADAFPSIRSAGSTLPLNATGFRV